MGGDTVVGAGGHQSDGGVLSGGGGGKYGRGQGGGVMEGKKRKTPRTEHQKRINVTNLTS